MTWTDEEIHKLAEEAEADARNFDDNPQYGGSIVAALCREIERERRQKATARDQWMEQVVATMASMDRRNIRLEIATWLMVAAGGLIGAAILVTVIALLLR